MDRRVIDVAEVMGKAELSYLPIMIATMCGLLAVCDGLDNQALAFTAPVIAGQWGIKMPAFVPVFTIGLIGLMAGSFVGGWLGDRFGRKTAILAAALCFGATTLVTPWCTTLEQLMIVRFIGGLGIGGLPSALAALIAESAPERNRTSFTLWALVGIPVGGFVGGFAASWMIPHFGWQSVFYVAGLLSLAVLLLAALLIPESTHFLALRNIRTQQLAATLNRIDPKGGYGANDEFILPAADRRSTSLAHLFTDGRGRMTSLFWIAEVVELMIFYVLVNWTPTLFRETGLPIETAALGTAALNMGAILATIGLGPICRRFGEQRVTAATFVVTSVALLFVVLSAGHLASMMIGIFFAGAGCIGGQAAVVMLMAALSHRYPLHRGWLGTDGGTDRIDRQPVRGGHSPRDGMDRVPDSRVTDPAFAAGRSLRRGRPSRRDRSTRGRAGDSCSSDLTLITNTKDQGGHD